MAKIDLITISGLTASDGSNVAIGAILKFMSEFMMPSTIEDVNVIIRPQVYRSRELFEAGYSAVEISPDVIPYDFVITLVEADYYVLTPALLYERVRDHINDFLGADVFEVNITT